MKPLSRKKEQRATNCTGPMQLFDVVLLQVEDADVGATYPHFGGYRHRDYQIKKTDVGRLVERVTQMGYVCWYFTDAASAERGFNYKEAEQ